MDERDALAASEAGGEAPPDPSLEAAVTGLLRFRSEPLYEGLVATLPELTAGSNASAVRLVPPEDARELQPYLGRLLLVEVAFRSYRDGRGYSAARILREELGYEGELRAVGDVLVDQLPFLRRCGFDAFLPDQPLDEATVARALSRYQFVYQGAADGRPPVWRLRHG